MNAVSKLHICSSNRIFAGWTKQCQLSVLISMEYFCAHFKGMKHCHLCLLIPVPWQPSILSLLPHLFFQNLTNKATLWSFRPLWSVAQEQLSAEREDISAAIPVLLSLKYWHKGLFLLCVRFGPPDSNVRINVGGNVQIGALQQTSLLGEVHWRVQNHMNCELNMIEHLMAIFWLFKKKKKKKLNLKHCHYVSLLWQWVESHSANMRFHSLAFKTVKGGSSMFHDILEIKWSVKYYKNISFFFLSRIKTPFISPEHTHPSLQNHLHLPSSHTLIMEPLAASGYTSLSVRPTI